MAIASARGLAEAGIPVLYVCATGPIAPELEHPRITVRCLNIQSVWKHTNPAAAAARGIWNGRALAELEAILAHLPAAETVVHFHQWTKSFSPSVLAAPSRRGLAGLVSLHDYFLSCPNGAYYRFPEGEPCDLTPMSGACLATRCDSRSTVHKAVRVARQVATTRALARVGSTLSVLSVSPFAEQVIDKFLPPRLRRFVLRSPIEIPRDAPVAVADNAQFVFVGRLTVEKGVRQLARVARDTGLPVTFAGDGPVLEELRRFGPPVTCTGWLDADGLETVLRQARALMFPSTWYETGGLVVLEALARGIPALVSETTAAADFIIDGRNGFLVDPFDGDTLRNRMLDMADDARVRRMGQDAYARYWADPQSMHKHVTGLLDIYRTILSEQRQPASAA